MFFGYPSRPSFTFLTIASYSNSAGTTVGVAKGATLVAVKVLTQADGGATSWIIEGITVSRKNACDTLIVPLRT